MFKWSAFLLLCGKVLCVSSQTLKYAEKRVINGAGMDYVFHQQLASSEQSQGLSAYSSFAQKMPDQPGELPKNVRTIIVTKKVPVPYPVQVEKKVPVPVKVPIRRPYTVYVPRPYYVEVMKQVPVPVKVPVPQPYTVEKHVPFPFKVHYDKPFPVHITKPYPVYYEKRVPIHVEKPVAVPYKVHVDRPMPVNIPMERPMYFPVERPYHFPVKVPVDKPSQVHQPVPVPVTVEKPHLAASEQSRIHDYYTSTQPTVLNTFSPSPYDELTSTMLTEGKHKVISFLPGSQNTFGSYGSSSADIGTIHVSNIKGNGGNATDWVPKAIPNNQYLTYIPNTQPKFLHYTSPEKASKLQEVNNAEPYVVKHGSVKMHYKLHYDPTKQEYSFQLAPKTQSNQFGRHTGYSYQSANGESNQDQSSPPTEYVYKTSEGQHLGSTFQFPTKPAENELTYSYQHVYQSKPETHSAQQSADSPTLTYYPSEEQQQSQYKHEAPPYAFQTIDSESKPSYDTNSQVTGRIPEVTYSYQPAQAMDGKPQMQHLSSGPHQVTYTYESVGGDGKVRFEPNSKNLETYPTEHVSYMYIPQSSVSHSHSGSVENPNAEAQYSFPSEQSGLSTEYPQMLYQQGRIATILREQYVTPVPQTDAEGRIPENYKSSRTSERLSYYHDNNDTQSSSTEDINARDNQHVNEISASSVSDNYQVHNIHPTSYNQTVEDAPTSSIKFEKFGVADVMNGIRTKLYPVNDSSDSQLQSNVDFSESSSSTSGYEQGTPFERYFQDSGTSLEATEGPFNAKVYRLSTYKVPRSRRVTRTKLKKSNDLTQSHQDQTIRHDGDTEKATTLSSVEWYEFFGTEEPKNQKNVAKETNSHTGAAERAPFYGITTPTATTTTSNSLQPPDETITIKPTQSLRTRSRGSVKAYVKRRGESSTEGNSNTTTTRTRRRRRPARRRMDKASESPVEEELP